MKRLRLILGMVLVIILFSLTTVSAKNASTKTGGKRSQKEITEQRNCAKKPHWDCKKINRSQRKLKKKNKENRKSLKKKSSRYHGSILGTKG